MSSDSTFRWGGLAAGALAGALALASCADFSRGEPSPAPDAGARPDGGDAAAPDGAALSFAVDVYPLLVPACQSCHATGEEAGDTNLLFTGSAPDDYPTVVTFVDTSAPAGSRLLSKAERQRSPGRSGVRRGIARVPEDPATGFEQGALP